MPDRGAPGRMTARVACRWLALAFVLGLVIGTSLPAPLPPPVSAQAGDNVPIVYSRCPRTREPLVVTGTVRVGDSETTATKTLQHLDVLDVLPDVVHFYGGFAAPCDLVYRGADGAERVLYDCSSGSTPGRTCAALDAAVSFDAKQVAFAVFRGRIKHDSWTLPPKFLHPGNQRALKVQLPNPILDSTEAQLYIADVATGQSRPLPHVRGTFDSGPAWLSSGQLAFTSTRSGQYSTPVGSGQRLASQIFVMDLDGRNVEKVSYHALAGEEHPIQLMDGRVAVASWQLFGMLPYRTDNSAAGGFGTIHNFFHVYSQNPDGANPFPLFGQHTSKFGPGPSGHPPHLASHFFGQSSDGRLWTADYYRRNNAGLGQIVGFPLPPAGQEGEGPESKPHVHDLFRPKGFATLTSWATGSDNFSRKLGGSSYRLPGYADPLAFAGKVSHPAGLPGNQLMLTWGAGPCSTVPSADGGRRAGGEDDGGARAGDAATSKGAEERAGRPPAEKREPKKPGGKFGKRLAGKGAGGGQTAKDPADDDDDDEDDDERPRAARGGGGPGFGAVNALNRLGRDNPGCDAGIYRTTRIPSRHPSDLAVIVNRPEYHEIMARAVVPYAAIHGIERPAVIPRAALAAAGNPDLPVGTPYGILGASSIILRETRALNGHPFSAKPGHYPQWGLQGTDTVDYTDAELCGIRMLVTQPSLAGDRNRFHTTVGERVGVLGEFPVRKFDGAGKPTLDPSGVPDTSFTVRFPANVPYLMQGIDCQGRTLNTDQTWQSLRPGEVKTCNGCHLHSKPGLPFERTAAARGDHRPVRLGEGEVPLLVGGSGSALEVTRVPGYSVSYEFERDVFPILQRRCASCHSAKTPAAGLVLDAPGTGPGSTYDRLVMDRAQKFVPEPQRYPHQIRKPQLTKYVRALNARGSLLYWKAANRRTDGRTDDQYGPRSPQGWEDVDFGADHPTSITPPELGVLSRWLDTGAAAGEAFLKDTTPPVLDLAAQPASGGGLILTIGMVDVPSGIDTRSLEVCVAPPGADCGSNLVRAGVPHGVVTVTLAASAVQPDAEVRARVSDRAGNGTEARRTISWLLRNAPARKP